MLFRSKKMPANNMQYVKETPVITLKEGQELLVRVYPWYNGTASGKTICLSDLTIHGMAVDGSAGIHLLQNPNAVSSSFFTLDGRQQQSLRRGLNIVRMADGTTKKVVKN